MATISYAITVCNEHEELEKLLSSLSGAVRTHDEVVVVYDQAKVTTEVRSVLDRYGVTRTFPFSFVGDFAALKNYLNSVCRKKWIFQLDADEVLNDGLKYSLHDLLDSAGDVDLFLVPRINIVNGLTAEHVARWNWSVNEHGHVNFPDYQARIYRNLPDIRYGARKVHETIIGHKLSRRLATAPEWCLLHVKNIARQEKQNGLYSQLESQS